MCDEQTARKWSELEISFLNEWMNRRCLKKWKKYLEEENMSKIDECYNQPTGMADAGTTTPAGKIDTVSLSKFSRNMTTVATEEHGVKDLRDMQLGSNGMQSNGFSYKLAENGHPAPRRGFDQE